MNELINELPLNSVLLKTFAVQPDTSINEIWLYFDNITDFDNRVNFKAQYDNETFTEFIERLQNEWIYWNNHNVELK